MVEAAKDSLKKFSESTGKILSDMKKAIKKSEMAQAIIAYDLLWQERDQLLLNLKKPLHAQVINTLNHKGYLIDSKVVYRDLKKLNEDKLKLIDDRISEAKNILKNN